MNNKANWITTWENTTGNSLNYSNIEEDRDSYKQASNSNTSIPNWLITLRNLTGEY